MKTLKEALGFLLVLPLVLLTKLRFIKVRDTMLYLGHFPFGIGNLMRRKYLCAFAGSCGKNVIIGDGFEVNMENMRDLHVAEHVWIHRNVAFGAVRPCAHPIRLLEGAVLYDNCRLGAHQGPVTIGEHSMVGYNSVIRGPFRLGNNAGIAHNCTVLGMTQQYENSEASFLTEPVLSSEVVVDDEAWVGSNVVILYGVTIGKHSVVGAGSVVTHDVPPYSVAVGSPAKVIKKYDHEKKQWVGV